MKQSLKTLYRWLVLAGLDPRRTIHLLRGLPRYLRDMRTLRSQRAASAHPFAPGRLYPCLADRASESGSARGHYFHQDLLVARRLFLSNPTRHIDIGSRIDGFVAHVAAFRPIQVIDARPLTTPIPNVAFIQADFMAPLPPELTGCCDSASCLHALEHFGLGRYGDPIRYDGYLDGLSNLHRLLAPGGALYLSVPIGPGRIEFNAHRVFALSHLLELIDGRFTLDRFSFVDDRGDLHEAIDLTPPLIASHCGCTFGCGILELTRL